MKILWAEFRNFCQYRNRRVFFYQGLNAILGPNGSGKSNLLNGLYYAFTGDSRGVGTLSSNIYSKREPKEESSVRAAFQHAGVEAIVTRKLYPEEVLLELPGEEPIRGARKVNAHLEQILNLPRKMFDDFIFIEQTKLSSFLSMRPADRALSLQRLFGTQHAEKCWKEVGDYLTELKIPIPRIDVSACTSRISSTERSINGLEEALANIDISDTWSAANDPDMKVIQDLKYKNHLLQEVKVIKQQIKTLEYEKEKLERNIHNQKQASQYWQNQQPSIDIYEIQKILTLWQAYHQNERQRLDLETQVEALQQEALQNREPTLPEDHQKDSVFYVQVIAHLQEEKHLLDQYISTFAKTGRVVCPTCGLPQPEDQVEDKKQRLALLNREVAFAQQRLQASQEYQQKRQEYELWSHGYTIKTKSLIRQLNHLAVIDPPNQPEEELLELQEKHIHVKGELSKINMQLASMMSSYEILSGRLQAFAETLQSKENTLSILTVTSDDAIQASENLEHKQTQYKLKLKYQAEINTLKVSLSSDRKALEEATKVLDKAAKVTEFSDVLKEVRSVLHRDALPKLVSQGYLELLEDDINKVLEDLSQPFRIKTTQDLGFMAEFLNDVVQPAERLSFGQQAVLSIAMRIVVNATFAGDIGLLCLDEPTAGLDETNLTGLEVALQKLSELSCSCGLQCFLVTHEKSLAPLFDHVIELSAPS